MMQIEAHPVMPRARILVLTTGGTIAMAPQTGGGIAPAVSGADLIDAVPELAAIATIEVEAFSNKPGASLQLQDLRKIAALIEAAHARGCTGVVVVQGTDTIEETSFALELLVDGAGPLVITGAMRGAGSPGSDGPANLIAAVTVAACPKVAGMGALVVLGDQIHAARHVQKAHTAMPSAFGSPGTGMVGLVCEGRVHLFWHLTALPTVPQPVDAADTAVALIKVALGDDGRLLKELPGLGYGGAVVEAMGAGHMPAWLAPVIGELVSSMPVILSTRVGTGPVLTASYVFPGSESDLLARGAIGGGSLGGLKATLLLRLLLAGGVPRERLSREFARRSALYVENARDAINEV
jgi:L-asparaginase